MSKVFNKKNLLGRACLCAWIPGWDEFEAQGSASVSGGLRSIGQQFPLASDAVGVSNNSAEVVHTSYPLMGQVSPVLFTQGGSGERTRFQNSDNNLGIRFPDLRHLTVVSIFKPTGDGVPSAGGNPSLFSMDEGTAEVDKDMKVGIAGSGNNIVTTIRIGEVVATATNTGNVQDDEVQLIAGGIRIDSSGDTEIFAGHLTSGGIFSEGTNGTRTQNSYNPRTTTDMAIGAAAAAAENVDGFAGEILGVWAFDVALGEADLRAFFDNPWQIFKPQRILVPVGKYVPVEEIILPATVVGNITFSTTQDQAQTHQLTGEVASTFLTNLLQAQSNVKTTSNSITYGLTLDQLQEYSALVLGAITFGLTLDQVDIINKITSNAETLGITLDEINTLNKITSNIQNFDVVLDEAELNVKTTSNSITYGLTLDQLQEYGALVLGAVTFGLTLDQVDIINKITSNAETLGITLDEINTLNKITSNIQNFDVVLDEAELNVKTTSNSITYDLTLDQVEAIDGAIAGALTFGLSLDQASTVNKITSNAETLGITLDEVHTLNKIMSETGNFALVLDEAELNVKTTPESDTFGLILDKTDANAAARSVSFSAQIDLSQIETNQAVRVEEYIQGLTLNQQNTNVKTSEGLITFTTDLDYQTLKQLAANISITLSTNLDYLGTAEGAGEINAFINFIVTADQTHSKIMTADKAASFVLNAAQQHNVQLDKLETLTLAIQAADSYINSRSKSDSVSFNTDLQQSHSNTLDKLLLMTFNASLDKSLSTAGSTWGGLVTLATVLSSNFNTEGEVLADITYGLGLTQQQQINKLTDVSMGFGVDADIVTEIHLTVERGVSFSSIMDQTEAKQLLGQSEITFGHIHGLASLNSAVMGKSIAFGNIQDYQINGFVAQFTITTPDSRILKVYIEDRTLLVDGETRQSRINKT